LYIGLAVSKINNLVFSAFVNMPSKLLCKYTKRYIYKKQKIYYLVYFNI